MIDGMIAIPASCGPQVPSKASPNDEPIRPAKMLLIQPIEPPFFVKAPAIAPMYCFFIE